MIKTIIEAVIAHKWLIGSVVALLIVLPLISTVRREIRRRKIRIAIPSMSIPGREAVGKFWDKHGVETLKFLVLISVSLFFINWLCGKIGYEKYVLFRRSDFFWVAHFALVFSLYTLTIEIKSWIPKAAALIVIGIIASGVWNKVNPSSAADTASVALAKELAQLPERLGTPTTTGEFKVKAGEWKEFAVGPKIKLTMTSGIAFTCRVNNDPMTYRSGPQGGNLNLDALVPKGTLIKTIWFQPDQEMIVTLTDG
jgi:hypothetical protein